MDLQHVQFDGFLECPVGCVDHHYQQVLKGLFGDRDTVVVPGIELEKFDLVTVQTLLSIIFEILLVYLRRVDQIYLQDVVQLQSV